VVQCVQSNIADDFTVAAEIKEVMMTVDVESIKQGLSAMGMVLGLFKQAKDLLPAGPKKDEIDEVLRRTERELKLAESQVAHGLEYELCRNHWPPEIMLSEDEIHWKCPVCPNEKSMGNSVIIPPRDILD
jgi:hypothetical protein